MTITSRERVLTAIEHREPDKVPIDCGAMRSTGIMAIAYANLKQYLGITNGRVRVYDFGQQLAEIEREILDRFEVDVVDIENTSLCDDGYEWKPFPLSGGIPAEVSSRYSWKPDEKGGYLAIDDRGKPWARMPNGCLYFETIQPPLGEPRKPIKEYDLPSLTDEQLESIRRRAKYLFENTEYALMGGFGGNILEAGQSLRGWGNFMMDMAEDPGFTEAFINRLVERHLENLKRYLEAVGDSIQLIQMGDDLGTQAGPQLSREMYHQFIFPAHKKIYSCVKQNYPQVKVFLHSCGSVETFIEDFIEAGVDALNPVQTSAVGMDPVHLKQTYGNRITFWGGGYDLQSDPNASTEDEIREQVQERIRIFGKGGGYVFAAVHNIQANIVPEKILAIYNAAKS